MLKSEKECKKSVKNKIIKNCNKDRINITDFFFCLKLQYHSEQHCYWSRLLNNIASLQCWPGSNISSAALTQALQMSIRRLCPGNQDQVSSALKRLQSNSTERV